ncbi:glutamine-hydrolyzing GMP synthase [Mesoterricola silvestris]|uniref:GMP synthase [glutamine-hydrolyzing] n=1 Tax=Mesoterricola silvestris TaxID=2927979 RepID=A0AA48GRW1_9BACT|nr:glutamine-hydrolyzing GMP synthase [Mesoterricola silvestris]BDU73095.1 GMP synthase [glutamine-hydrolyzing] [Mesoterricola silvestris]
MHHERVAILDFGSQYTRLITRRLRDLGAFGLVYGPGATAKEIGGPDLKGVILSGGPNSVMEDGAPDLDPAILALGVPILGICYGQQLLARNLGGVIHRSSRREYGKAMIRVLDPESLLFRGLETELQVWMSHGDHVEQAPAGFAITSHTRGVPVAAMEDRARRIYCIQFHPEVTHTQHGSKVLMNFLHVCGMKLDWNTGQFIEEKTRAIRKQVGTGRVVLGLSGGVDSSVAAVLLHKAIGKQLTCVFVDTGVMRKDEMAQVQEAFAPYDMTVKWVDARQAFLGALEGVSDPEQKRKIIGRTFIEVFDREAGQVQADFLAQGTLYPDVIESSGVGGAVLVKSHHNVGGLPDVMKLKLVEPLRELFKDEVRRAGLALGLPEDMVWRHPFPGPGLAVRIPGCVTAERVAILQNADAIFIEELKASGWYRNTSQCFAVLLPVQTVGIMGDERTYENMCALRAVTSEDFMTADWARLPHELLEKVAQRIVNEVKGINRVVFDITSKPPATIEYE